MALVHARVMFLEWGRELAVTVRDSNQRVEHYCSERRQHQPTCCFWQIFGRVVFGLENLLGIEQKLRRVENTGSITAAACAMRSDEIRRLLVMCTFAITEQFPPQGPFTIQVHRPLVSALIDEVSEAFGQDALHRPRRRIVASLRSIRSTGFPHKEMPRTSR